MASTELDLDAELNDILGFAPQALELPSPDKLPPKPPDAHAATSSSSPRLNFQPPARPTQQSDDSKAGAEAGALPKFSGSPEDKVLPHPDADEVQSIGSNETGSDDDVSDIPLFSATPEKPTVPALPNEKAVDSQEVEAVRSDRPAPPPIDVEPSHHSSSSSSASAKNSEREAMNLPPEGRPSNAHRSSHIEQMKALFDNSTSVTSPPSLPQRASSSSGSKLPRRDSGDEDDDCAVEGLSSGSSSPAERHHRAPAKIRLSSGGGGGPPPAKSVLPPSPLAADPLPSDANSACENPATSSSSQPGISHAADEAIRPSADQESTATGHMDESKVEAFAAEDVTSLSSVSPVSAGRPACLAASPEESEHQTPPAATGGIQHSSSGAAEVHALSPSNSSATPREPNIKTGAPDSPASGTDNLAELLGVDSPSSASVLPDMKPSHEDEPKSLPAPAANHIPLGSAALSHTIEQSSDDAKPAESPSKQSDDINDLLGVESVASSMSPAAAANDNLAELLGVDSPSSASLPVLPDTKPSHEDKSKSLPAPAANHIPLGNAKPAESPSKQSDDLNDILGVESVASSMSPGAAANDKITEVAASVAHAVTAVTSLDSPRSESSFSSSRKDSQTATPTKPAVSEEPGLPGLDSPDSVKAPKLLAPSANTDQKNQGDVLTEEAPQCRTDFGSHDQHEKHEAADAPSHQGQEHDIDQSKAAEVTDVPSNYYSEIRSTSGIVLPLAPTANASRVDVDVNDAPEQTHSAQATEFSSAPADSHAPDAANSLGDSSNAPPADASSRPSIGEDQEETTATATAQDAVRSEPVDDLDISSVDASSPVAQQVHRIGEDELVVDDATTLEDDFAAAANVFERKHKSQLESSSKTSEVQAAENVEECFSAKKDDIGLEDVISPDAASSSFSSPERIKMATEVEAEEKDERAAPQQNSSQVPQQASARAFASLPPPPVCGGLTAAADEGNSSKVQDFTSGHDEAVLAETAAEPRPADVQSPETTVVKKVTGRTSVTNFDSDASSPKAESEADAAIDQADTNQIQGKETVASSASVAERSLDKELGSVHESPAKRSVEISMSSEADVVAFTQASTPSSLEIEGQSASSKELFKAHTKDLIIFDKDKKLEEVYDSVESTPTGIKSCSLVDDASIRSRESPDQPETKRIAEPSDATEPPKPIMPEARGEDDNTWLAGSMDDIQPPTVRKKQVSFSSKPDINELSGCYSSEGNSSSHAPTSDVSDEHRVLTAKASVAKDDSDEDKDNEQSDSSAASDDDDDDDEAQFGLSQRKESKGSSSKSAESSNDDPKKAVAKKADEADDDAVPSKKGGIFKCLACFRTSAPADDESDSDESSDDGDRDERQAQAEEELKRALRSKDVQAIRKAMFKAQQNGVEADITRQAMEELCELEHDEKRRQLFRKKPTKLSGGDDSSDDDTGLLMQAIKSEKVKSMKQEFEEEKHKLSGPRREYYEGSVFRKRCAKQFDRLDAHKKGILDKEDLKPVAKAEMGEFKSTDMISICLEEAFDDDGDEVIHRHEFVHMMQYFHMKKFTEGHMDESHAWAILQLDPDTATHEDVVHSYHALARKYHPDKRKDDPPDVVKRDQAEINDAKALLDAALKESVDLC